MIAILYDTVNNYILSRNVTVSTEFYPQGENPDYKYFIPYEPFTVPNYDDRYYDLSLKETPLNSQHPTYPLYKEWFVEHILTKRSNDNIYISVDNACRLANASLIDFDLQAMAFAIIIKKIELTTDELQILSNWVDVGNKLTNNRQLAINMKSQISQGQEPDIDVGWERKQ